MTHPSRRRRIALRFVAVAVAPVLALALTELVLRLAGYDPFADLFSDRDRARSVVIRASHNQELVYELVPGAQAHAWGTEVQINADGFRDRAYAVAKPPGTYRLVTIGDSITFGNHLAANEAFPEQLEELLRSNRSTVEVLNLAVAGYDTLQEVAFLEERGLKYEPDLVVVGYCLNDVGVHSASLSYVRRLESYSAWYYRLRALQSFAVLRDRFDETRHFKHANDEDVFRRENEGRIASLERDAAQLARIERLRDWLTTQARRSPELLSWYQSEAHLGKLRYAFERLRDLATKHVFDVVVVIVPHLGEGEFQPAYQIAYEIVREEAARQRFEVLEVYQEFRSAGFPRVVPNNRVHPSREGHGIIARKLRDYLLENKLQTTPLE